MVYHYNLGTNAEERCLRLQGLVRGGKVAFGGNKKLKIYGFLNCSSGKRMKAEHRVFFESEAEAIQNGFRPCGNCMHEKYKQWKGLG